MVDFSIRLNINFNHCKITSNRNINCLVRIRRNNFSTDYPKVTEVNYIYCVVFLLDIIACFVNIVFQNKKRVGGDTMVNHLSYFYSYVSCCFLFWKVYMLKHLHHSIILGMDYRAKLIEVWACILQELSSWLTPAPMIYLKGIKFHRNKLLQELILWNNWRYD